MLAKPAIPAAIFFRVSMALVYLCLLIIAVRCSAIRARVREAAEKWR
jgi:hypothetical protein